MDEAFRSDVFRHEIGVLAKSHPIELTPTRLLRLSKNLPHDWKEQRCFLGFAA